MDTRVPIEEATGRIANDILARKERAPATNIVLTLASVIVTILRVESKTKSKNSRLSGLKKPTL